MTERCSGGSFDISAVPGMGVLGPGKVPSPARMAGPYVPLCLLKKCLCVSGVPTYSKMHTHQSLWLLHQPRGSYTG